MKNQKGIASLVTILLIVLAVAVVGGGYIVYKDKQQQNKLEAQIQDLQKTPSNETNNNTTTSIVLLPAQAGLSAVVEAKRQAIYQAALSHDFNKLKAELTESSIDSKGTGIMQFGVDGKAKSISGYTAYQNVESKISIFDLIPTLLKLPYSVSDPYSHPNSLFNAWTSEHPKNPNSDNIVYTWPSPVTKSPKDWTATDIANLKTFLTDGQIADFQEFYSYSYFNIVITSDGKWIDGYTPGD